MRVGESGVCSVSIQAQSAAVAATTLVEATEGTPMPTPRSAVVSRMQSLRALRRLGDWRRLEARYPSIAGDIRDDD